MLFQYCKIINNQYRKINLDSTLKNIYTSIFNIAISLQYSFNVLWDLYF